MPKKKRKSEAKKRVRYDVSVRILTTQFDGSKKHVWYKQTDSRLGNPTGNEGFTKTGFIKVIRELRKSGIPTFDIKITERK